MSATGRSDVRRGDDFYATPQWCVHRLLEALPLHDGAWLEPCAGDGAIIRAVRTSGADPTWTAYEIRPEAEPELRRLPGLGKLRCGSRGNFLVAVAERNRDERAFDVVLTNPPFSSAMEFIEACLPLASTVCMLLRLNFLASERRAAFMRATPPDVYVLPNRPSFTGGGTDATEYCWAVWPPERQRSAGSLRVLSTTPTRVRGCP